MNFNGIVSYGQDANYKAYSLFVYNFMKYIEWPSSSGSQFVIGVMGDSPALNELNKLASVKKVKGKSIIIKKISSAEGISNCDLLYVADSGSKSFKESIASAKQKGVLVVCEREGMAKRGAGINFVMDDNDNLRFEVNKGVLAQNSLKISSTLLNLGYEVN